MNITKEDIYQIVFKDYPDVMNVKQASILLGVSTKTVYKLIKEDELQCIKVGREFRIPKVTIMKYVQLFENKSSE